MNSCRRGLADRTWSVTRWLWRDRYTLSCLEENNYTHSVSLQAHNKAPTHFIHMSFHHVHLIVSILTSLSNLYHSYADMIMV